MNIICLIGIQQFLYLYSIHTYENYIALLIYVNGVIYHSFIKTKYGLCISYYDILIDNAHRASSDARATGELFIFLIQEAIPITW